MASKYNKELLEPIITSSFSWAEVLRKLGLKQTGGNQVYQQTIARNLGIDVSHFRGSLWSKGLTSMDHPSLEKSSAKLRTPDNRIFIRNCQPITGDRIKKRLIKKGWEYKCKECGLKNWKGKPLTLHLDHINGIHNDNRLTNLQFLCPNCHQQTETWGNKKRPGGGIGKTRKS